MTGAVAGRTRVSCCTIARGRTDHLHNLLVGLERQTRAPDEVIVVAMGDIEVLAEASAHPVVTATPSCACGPDDPLPLARARNSAAAAATGDLLVFLDVDCIPDERLVEGYLAAARPGLLMGGVSYLPPGEPNPDTDWCGDTLRALGRPHPDRPLSTGVERTESYELFWSLNFAATRQTWETVGGFDEMFVGYGAEDTDLGFRARACGVPAWTVSDAEAYHQHHPSNSPPLEHLLSIVANARRFHERWGRWPMEGWLQAFADQGLVRWTDTELVLT